MIQFDHVSKTYPNGTDALHDINLRIGKGEFVFIVGPSGAGKSTLVKLMSREEKATEGTVIVAGYNLNKIRSRQVSRLRRTMGLVFQDYRLIPELSVYDNIAFTMRVTDAAKHDIARRVQYVLSLVGLEEKADVLPTQLSGGEQQRVSLARALANNPRLIIADEPTGNIDPRRSYEIMDLLTQISECGTTVVVITHEHGLIRNFNKRVITVEKGRIVSDVPPTPVPDPVEVSAGVAVRTAAPDSFEAFEDGGDVE